MTIPRESVAGSPAYAQPQPSQPVAPEWWTHAYALHKRGCSNVAIARELGYSREWVGLILLRMRDAAQPDAIREPKPEIWLGGPREPVAFLQVRRPIVIPEAEITHPAPGLYVSR